MPLNEARINKLLEFKVKSPDDPFFLYALATEYVAGNENLIALDYFKLLISDFPSYHATYYHLGKLYERMNEIDKAIEIYNQGISLTNQLKESHAESELRSALEELEFN